MLNIQGSLRKLCTGVSRRDFLQIGGWGASGLTLSSLLEAADAPAPTEGSAGGRFGQAKQCIILFLYGSPSQLETFDMKPDAPVEIRGTMQPVASSLPGLDVCEHLPQLARVMDRTTVIRSCVHPYPIHGVAYAMTGIDKIDVAMELDPFDARHHPYFASAAEYIWSSQGRDRRSVQNVALPFPFSSKRTDQPLRAGPYGGFLGPAHRPVWTEFLGEGTVEITKARTGFSYEGLEPYLGCTRDSHFRVASTGALPDMTLNRLNRRRSLLGQLDDLRHDLDRSQSGESLNRFQEMAFSLLMSPAVSDALDVRQEVEATRDLYGMTLFGQGCLAARRLVEAGTRIVSVFWDEYGLAGDAWDTHANHYPRMKEQLLPPFDRALSGLLIDLERRGMLDETLVVCVSEHGRTPRINKAAGGGRDHWARAYSTLLAGGGIARGRVVGATDGHASDVTETPVSPKDILATMYHLLGIDPHSRIPDRTGRPVGLLPENSRVVTEAIG